ncbi:MAG: alpha/beta hydrolase family protein [Bryobacteraceae bacterium]
MSARTMILALVLAAAPAVIAQTPTGVASANVQTVQFQSAALGEERMVNILLPRDYEKSARRYGVVYLLHGLGDNHMMWSLRSNIAAYANRHDVIVVMPDGSKSFYVNSAADPKAKFEDLIVKDVVDYVDSHYRTLPVRRSRAIVGLSMGGYGSMFLGLKNYKRFGAIGAFSGALGIAHDWPEGAPDTGRPLRRRPEIEALFGEPGSQTRKDHDPFLLLDKVPLAEMPFIYVACGGQDFLIAENRAFVELLAKKGVQYEYREISPRIHSWDFWDDHARVFLNLISRLPGFQRP